MIHFSGDDAIAFLHGQLTSDVAGLPPGRSQYSGYCTPKGRLLASFLLWRDASGCCLQLPAALREPVQKRLSMFVLRSKVKVSDASDEHARFGIAGESATAVLQSLAVRVPRQLHEVVQSDGITVIRLPVDRYEILAPQARAQAVREALAAGAQTVPEAAWERLDIHAGIPVITPATQEEFVPQMVNFDLIGAVSYTKGCYPGQEIVARTHYLGRLKQRMYLANVPTDTPPRPGDKLYAEALGDQAAGRIVNAAPSPEGGCDVLAVIQIASAQNEAVHWKTPDGPTLRLLPLPYQVTASG
ncbi:MAG: folate-binding protein YgfZ [Burkholderiales bacterium]|nr:folate-binding protein YgfZ [Burkholderiales bacterium]